MERGERERNVSHQSKGRCSGGQGAEGPTCVDVGVFLHVALLVEPLPAVGAGIGSRVTVYEEVRGQGAGSLEGLSALLALKHLLHVVDGPVRERKKRRTQKRKRLVSPHLH